MSTTIENIDFTKYVPFRNADRTVGTYTPPVDFRKFIETARSNKIDKKLKTNLYTFFKEKIIELNPDSAELDWDTIELYFKQKTKTSPAVILLKTTDNGFKTRNNEGIAFRFTKLLGENFLEKILNIPLTSTTYIESYVKTILELVFGNKYTTEINEGVDNDGFTHKSLYIKPTDVKSRLLNDGELINLKMETHFTLFDLIELQEDKHSKYIAKIDIVTEPTYEWYQDNFKNMIDLRHHAFPRINQYMEILYQKLCMSNIKYTARNKKFTFPTFYETVNVYNVSLFKDTALPTKDTENAIPLGIAYTNGYFNNVIHCILFTLSSSPNQKDIGNGRGDYRYSKLNDFVVDRNSITKHPDYEHYYLFFTYEYVTSGLEGIIQTTDDDYDPKFNYNNFYGVGGYRKYVIDLSTCTLYSSTHYWTPAAKSSYSSNSYTTNTIGMVIPIEDSFDMLLPLYEYAKDLYLTTPLGKLSDHLGYRKQDTHVGTR